ncbi:MAG: S46 family peptidase [Ignavibacterium sp.]|nr:S46 family peptidase [Ignavibacterium sp.]MDW8375304.1 S46 family peptidase [Ignavibacteriales bacterium]
MTSKLLFNLNKLFVYLFLFTLIFQSQTFSQSYDWLGLDTIKAGKFDNGKMWTFEFPPIDYFKSEYGFQPSQKWFDDVRMAALRFANYCSASFVSEDGLVMTNHHCARQSITQVTKEDEGEDLHANGFIAEKLEDERPVPGLYVEQLVLIKDVTAEVVSEIEKGTNESERVKFEKDIISKIEKRESEATGLRCQVTALYNGGKYSLYGYKRYNDVRLVFAPEEQLGFFGGDPDNFTYPRYNLDCAFFRVYDENGKPLKTNHYFKWSKSGPSVGEPVFVVGNPGNTDRLNTVAQLEFMRDVQYPRTLEFLSGLIEIYKQTIKENPEKKLQMQDMLFSLENSQKANAGILKGLRDPILMQRKIDFENTFKASVKNNPKLNQKYGELWDKIAEIRAELKKIANRNFALSKNRLLTPQYFNIASELIKIANELKKPEDERDELYKGEELENSLKALIPENFDENFQNKLLEKRIEIFIKYLGKDDPIVKNFTGGRVGDAAVKYVLSKSFLLDLDKIKKLVEQGGDAILNSDDPFIKFELETADLAKNYQKQVRELLDKEESYNQQLGLALFEVYGTSIPPDATFTLRISDGIVDGFPYNGTVAPPFTTFYGMYDRYYSFNKEYPWSLPDRWKNPPSDFDLSTPFNFVSTNDIIGGNSGSPVINKNAEIVGLAFDGNIQSLPGNFIFRTEENRTVSVHSEGMIQAIDKVYKLKRLSEELRNGKISK